MAGDGSFGGPSMEGPADEEAERAVLAAALLDDGSLGVAWRARAIVRPEHFANAAHATIWEAALSVADRGEPLDVVTLARELTARGRINAVGGVQALGALTDIIPTTAHVETHARLVVEAATQRATMIAASRLRARAAQGAPLGDLQGGARELLEIVTSSSADDVVSLGQAAEEEEARFVSSATEGVITTGLRSLDAALAGGLWDGQTVVIGARPSTGKSSLGLGMALAAARECAKRAEGVVVYLSVEPPRRSLAARAACEWIARQTPHAPVDLMGVRARSLSATDAARYSAALDAVSALPLFISDRRDLTPAAARGLCLRLRARHGRVALVVVDYLQKVTPDRAHDSREREVAEISKAFSVLAGELRCPVVLQSQLNRKASERRPTMADLRESGAVEQDADVILLLHREKGVRDVVVEKQRDGATSDAPIPLGWVAAAAAFTDAPEGARGRERERDAPEDNEEG